MKSRGYSGVAWRILWLGTLAVLAASAALAQTPTAPGTAPPGSANSIPEKIEPQQPGQSPSVRPGEPLSETLDRTDGVLKPPAGVDLQMHVPPPETGSNMPVIPPPGSPGGDPSIQPK
jgi:hypothetical protein